MDIKGNNNKNRKDTDASIAPKTSAFDLRNLSNAIPQMQVVTTANISCTSDKRSSQGKCNQPLVTPGTSRDSRSRETDNSFPPARTFNKQKTYFPRTTPFDNAKAAESDLGVAVMLEPTTHLTTEQADTIKKAVHVALVEMILKLPLPGKDQPRSDTEYAPVFRGNPFLSEGVIKFWCGDNRALEWLKSAINKMASPVEGTTLVVKKQSEIPTRVKAALFVPGFSNKVDKLRHILADQNPWYNVQSWNFYSSNKLIHKEGKAGLFLTLGIPQKEIPNIMKKKRRLLYLTQSIFIRFYKPEGLLSHIPPPAIKPATITPPINKVSLTTEAPADPRRKSQRWLHKKRRPTSSIN